MPNPGDHQHDVRRGRSSAEQENRSRPDTASAAPGAATGGMGLHSAVFADQTPIPARFSREGDNLSPPLAWARVPGGTAEFAVTCIDSDAAAGQFVHWVVAGIPAGTTELGADGLPAGAVVGRNDFGQFRWDGPQPLVGDDLHRYFFRLYAADRPLEMTAGMTAAQLSTALNGHTIAVSTLVALFGQCAGGGSDA